MRVLIVSQWYPPEPVSYPADLARGLRALGHEATVLTGFPNYPSGRLYPGYRRRPVHRDEVNGVPIIRVPLYPDHSRSALKRSANYASFAASVVAIGPWVAPKVDVVHGWLGSIPCGMASAILSKVMRKPLTLEVQDIWPETLRATGMMRNPRVLGLIGRLAKWTYRQASAIRVISPGFRANLMEKGVPGDKIHVIPNWVDSDLYRPVEPDPGLASRLGMAGRFNVMFAGGLGLAQGLETVLLAAEQLRDVDEVQFVFAGDGPAEDSLRDMASRHGLSNVRFLGRFPRDDMPRLFALADALLVHLRDDPLFRITIPHKITTYFACGKPVLAAMHGDAAELVEKARAGVSCPSNDPQALAAAVRRLHALPKAEREALGRNGRSAAVTQYGRDLLVGKLAEVLERVVAKPARSARQAGVGMP